MLMYQFRELASLRRSLHNPLVRTMIIQPAELFPPTPRITRISITSKEFERQRMSATGFEQTSKTELHDLHICELLRVSDISTFTDSRQIFSKCCCPDDLQASRSTASLPRHEACRATDGLDAKIFPRQMNPGIIRGSSASGRSGKTQCPAGDRSRGNRSRGTGFPLAFTTSATRRLVMKKLLTLAVVLCLSVVIIGCGEGEKPKKSGTGSASGTGS